MRFFRAFGTWFGDHPWVVSVVALSLAILVPVGLQERSDRYERERDRQAAIEVTSLRAREACNTRNFNTEQFKTVGVQSDVALAQANTEALLQAASQLSDTPPSPEDAAVLRQLTTEQATAASTRIYDQLQLEDCDEVERDARRQAEAALQD